jgi:hypothetical protein
MKSFTRHSVVGLIVHTTDRRVEEETIYSSKERDSSFNQCDQNKFLDRHSKLAIPVTVDDEVDAPIGLGLAATVVGVSGGVALGEQRASEERAGILSVNIVVS